jgi:hypothetical protein
VPQKIKDRAPRVVDGGESGFGWDFDVVSRPFSGLACAVDRPQDAPYREVVPTFENLHLGCYDVEQRIRDMDSTGILASMCFPSMPGFGGTYLNNNPDKELSYACIQAWNDFMTEEWCGAAPGRMNPAVLVPLWDPHLTVKELERVEDRGVCSIVFSERPHIQGFPSLYSADRHWDPLFAKAEEMDLVISCYIGSSSRVDSPPDADYYTHMSEVWINAISSMTEYIFSGTFDRFPDLRVSFSEASIGWMPYQLQVMDRYYLDRNTTMPTDLKQKPSDYFGKNVFGCFIVDEVGAGMIEQLGVESITCEVDHLHADSLWPNIKEGIDRQLTHLSAEDQYKLRVSNAERIDSFTPSGIGQR